MFLLICLCVSVVYVSVCLSVCQCVCVSVMLHCAKKEFLHWESLVIFIQKSAATVTV